LNPGEVEILLLFHAALMLLFFIIQGITKTKVVFFSNIYYHTSLWGPILSGDSVPPTSQVHALIMLVLPMLILSIVKKYEFRVASSGIMSTPNFIIICPAILELKQVDRQT
jgi:hypothetical protein